MCLPKKPVGLLTGYGNFCMDFCFFFIFEVFKIIVNVCLYFITSFFEILCSLLVVFKEYHVDPDIN